MKNVSLFSNFQQVTYRCSVQNAMHRNTPTALGERNVVLIGDLFCFCLTRYRCTSYRTLNWFPEDTKRVYIMTARQHDDRTPGNPGML